MSLKFPTSAITNSPKTIQFKFCWNSSSRDFYIKLYLCNQT
jgi:hypothetical protein